ncbi:hypothetical protein CPHO_02040 [Corynebacterium phocae]|uniref:Uncharacterized protein n=1 Tax=Corynebacterium phocae TaxID=161895 RepID=A0A1L7D161_9CORY|nr:hypothetical protein CPHO_02040 [Corynebacterium phocae]
MPSPVTSTPGVAAGAAALGAALPEAVGETAGLEAAGEVAVLEAGLEVAVLEAAVDVTGLEAAVLEVASTVGAGASSSGAEHADSARAAVRARNAEAVRGSG